jgi:hypothetical protein
MAGTLSFPLKGRPDKILTKVSVCQAALVCSKFGLATKTVEALAFWDTGSNASCITYDLASRLNLIQVGTRPLGSVHARSDSPLFGLDIALQGNLTIPSILVAGIGRANGFDIILGMDVINRGDFHWTHSGEDSLLSFTIEG